MSSNTYELHLSHMAVHVVVPSMAKMAKPKLLPVNEMNINLSVVYEIVKILDECRAIRIIKQTHHNVQLETAYLALVGTSKNMFAEIFKNCKVVQVAIIDPDTSEERLAAIFSTLTTLINQLNTDWYDMYEQMCEYRNIV